MYGANLQYQRTRIKHNNHRFSILHLKHTSRFTCELQSKLVLVIFDEMSRDMSSFVTAWVISPVNRLKNGLNLDVIVTSFILIVFNY